MIIKMKIRNATESNKMEFKKRASTLGEGNANPKTISEDNHEIIDEINEDLSKLRKEFDDFKANTSREITKSNTQR